MISKQISRGIAFYFVTSLLFNSCAKFETREQYIDKPQTIIDQEELDAYNELKTYIDYSSQPNFKLGAELSLADVANNSLLYRLTQRHFDEIGYTELHHMNFIQADGSIFITDLQAALETNSAVSMPIHAGHLLWHENQQANYLNGLIADIIIPGESGKDIVENFEEIALGSSFPVRGSGSNIVVNDPDGKSGKVLNMKGAQTFPQFQINLPEGRKLGDYKTVTIDFKGGGCCGLYGAGMRMAITTAIGDVTLNNFNSPSSFGVGDNVWGRGLITLPLANLNLTPAMKEFTSFVLTIGSATGSADYLIDNITMNWEKIGEIIVKTPEERTQIFTNELDKYIKAIGEAGKDKIKSWSVVYQPIDEANPSKLRTGIGTTPPANTFYWQDYLGKDYAAMTIEKIKQYASADDNIFFTETNLFNNPAKIQGLMDFITYTEEKGVKVDGIATELALNLDADKAKIEAMLTSLAETGKLVKITGLDIGTGTSTTQTTSVMYQQQASMYKWFVEAYYTIIPANQRAGITFRSPIDQASNSTWRPNEPLGLWTNTANYLRKLSYQAVVEALEQQK
ncbi:endo-1,4-beta-xylanase [Sphingobacterium alkalisoli]|nr:endo-1,4-beta-xylanase [Sphingobacterium alkalisoli]